MNISFLFFSFGKLHSIKSNSSCIYVHYVLRFHLSACKMTSMEGGRGWGERDHRWYVFVSTTSCDLKPACKQVQQVLSYLPLSVPIFLWEDGDIHSNHWTILYLYMVSICWKLYSICCYGYHGEREGDWPTSLPLSYFSNPIPLCGQWCSLMFPSCNYHKEEFILI